MIAAILRELDRRCDDLRAAVKFYIAHADRSEAIATYHRLQEARGTRRAIRRLVGGA